MSPVKCIIIEDQLPAQKVLVRYINHLPELKLLDIFNNAVDAISYLRSQKVDLIFLDIHLPGLSGLDFLKTFTNRPKVILTRAYSEYALEGFELDVIDYLMKPISLDRFIRAVNKAIPESENSFSAKSNAIDTDSKKEKFIFVKDGRDIVKIFFEDIGFIKAEGDYVHVQCFEKKYLISYTMKFWEEILPNNKFSRIHKSFIINLERIDRISSNHAIVFKERIPIGRSYSQDFFRKIDLQE